MQKPKGAVEVQAYKDWTQGQPAKAMADMRASGAGEAYRRAWLVSVVGVREDAVMGLELWRDSYLDWLAESASWPAKYDADHRLFDMPSPAEDAANEATDHE